MNNKEIFFHLFNFLARTKHYYIKIELINSVINIRLSDGSLGAEIKYLEKENKIIYRSQNFLEPEKIFDLNTCSYL